MNLRALLLVILAGQLLSCPAGATQQTPQAISSEIDNKIITNQSGLIPASTMRQVLHDVSDSVPLLGALYPQGCVTAATQGTGGASPTNSSPGTVSAFGYLPECSGGGGGGANSGTAGNGSAGRIAAGGGGGGSANTGGTAGSGGNGGAGYARLTWIQ